MPFDIELSEAAFDSLDELDAHLQAAVAVHLRRLAESPALLSRPSASPPDPPGYQRFEFVVDKTRLFRVFFKYRSDEQTLWVGLIGHHATGGA